MNRPHYATVAAAGALSALCLATPSAHAADCSASAEAVDATCYPGRLQAAINQAIRTDRPLLLPRGVYPVSQALTINYAPVANRGFEIDSHGATIDGNSIHDGPVLVVTCSGGATRHPKGCFYFHQRGTLFVDGHTTGNVVRIGNFDMSDAHNSAVLDDLVVNNGGSGGAIRLEYVLKLHATIVADSAGSVGIGLDQVQFSTLDLAPSAARGYGVQIGAGYSFSNTVTSIDGEASPVCIDVMAGHAASNTFVAPYLDCPAAAIDPRHTLTLTNPSYGSDTRVEARP